MFGATGTVTKDLMITVIPLALCHARQSLEKKFSTALLCQSSCLFCQNHYNLSPLSGSRAHVLLQKGEHTVYLLRTAVSIWMIKKKFSNFIHLNFTALPPTVNLHYEGASRTRNRTMPHIKKEGEVQLSQS